MTTFTLPPALAALISPETAAYIERYSPNSLSEGQWQVVRASVCEMAARTEPTSVTDARTVLSALCRLLAWAEPLMGTLDLNAVLTDAVVERFTAELAGKLSGGGRDNHRGRLRRCLRVLAGEPARTKRGPRPTGAAPYVSHDLDRLKTAAAHDDNLAAALQTALRPTQAPSRRPDREGDVSDAVWIAARSFAEKAGVRLTRDRLRATRMHELLQRREALGTLVRDGKLTRRNLDNAMSHLPVPAPEEERDLLRG